MINLSNLKFSPHPSHGWEFQNLQKNENITEIVPFKTKVVQGLPQFIT